MTNKLIIIVISVVALVGFLAWLFIESSKPLPGQKMSDEGHEHVDIGTAVEYKTNPPTSGNHYADWTKAGVYKTPRDDRNLVHSLEHGYVIMSINCDFKPISLIPTASAHGLEEEATSGAEASSSANLSEVFRSDDCHKLVDQLISIYEKKGKHKLVVVLRPNLDSRIALTAWTYLDKFNPSTSSGLSVSEIERIEKFIDAHKDKGPEKTIEPAEE